MIYVPPYFLKDLHAEWEKSGAAVLKILAVENPEALAKLTAGLLPREHDIGGPVTFVVNTGVPRCENFGKPRAPLLAHDELLRLTNPKDDEA